VGIKALTLAGAVAVSAGMGAAADPPPIGVEVSARAVQPGELVVMTISVKPISVKPVSVKPISIKPISTPTDTPAPHVRAFDHDLPVFAIGPGRWRVLIGLDLDVKAGSHTVTIDAGRAHRAEALLVRPKRFPTRRLTVDPSFVTPPPEAADRIAGDARLLARAWESSAPERLWSDPFARPVREAANSAFGTRSIFNGLPRNAHGGADFLSPAGTAIHAPNAGRVLIARDLYYSGNTIVIDHGLGLFSTLAHLSAFDVHEGDNVTRLQLLGRVGATGRVTGPHLHWAIRAGGARVDPLSLLAVLGADN
jgi:murein DD-endopeptidase MepM/ murein hydrolase activator NlpD